MFRTKYTGPTDKGGSKVTAFSTLAGGHRRQTTIPYPYHLSGTDVHLAAVVAHIERLSGPITQSYVDTIERIEVHDLGTGYGFDFIQP